MADIEEPVVAWGSWQIASMPASVLDGALKDTDTQIAKIRVRLGKPHTRTAEFERTERSLCKLAAALEEEMEKRQRS